MIVIRRFFDNNSFNPFEYMMEGKNILNFKDKQQAIEFLQDKGLDIKDEEDVKSLGLDLHKISRGQLAQLSKEIKNTEKWKN